MNFFSRLTTVGKGCVIAIVVAIIGSVLYFSGATKALSVGGSSNDADITVSTNTYAGFLALVAANNGLEPNEDCEFYKRAGIKVKILVQDDFEASRAGGKSGETDILYATLDALPTEMSSAGTMTDYRYFLLSNFSAGADVIVANGSIQNVTDLKGKSVAVADGTASHTLLLNTLETSGLSESDVKKVVVGSGIDAAQAFKSKQVDAAVCWAPDDEDCVVAVKGSHVLTSTAQANQLVSDGFIAKKDWLDNNKELVKKFVEVLLWSNSEIKNNTEYFSKGAEVFANAYGTDVDFAKTTGKKVNFATLSDNMNWMGLNSDYAGMTGERVYTKMSRTYSSVGLAKSVMPWSKIVYTDIVESIEVNSIGNKQDVMGTAQKNFSVPTENIQTATAISSKQIVIDFAIGSYNLDVAAREVIDREFVDIAQQFSNARIRVVGNTSNTGNYNSNVALSQKRAQAVVDYLVSEYKMPKNKFVVVGAGPKKAITAGCTTEEPAYRTTDLEIIAE